MIETLDDILEQLADDLSIFGSHAEGSDHSITRCRPCWTAMLRMRIENALEVERKLSHDD
jgi:hypothetical protein